VANRELPTALPDLPNPADTAAKRRKLFEVLRDRQERRSQPLTGRVLARYRASPAQRRIWFLDRAAPAASAHNHAAIVEISGRLTHTALRQALNDAVRRHASLRTRFFADARGVWQSILPRYDLPLPVIDARGAPERTDSFWLELAQRVNQKPFELEQEPGIRAAVLQLGETRQWLLLTIHHIVFDAWSSGVLVRDIGAVLEAFSAGRVSCLPELEAEYEAALQREQASAAEDEAASALRDYWQSRLAGLGAPIELPYDFARPAEETFAAGLEACRLAPELTQRLLAFARARRTTLAGLLLGALNVLVSKLSGASDICIGVPVAGRESADAESLIGCFVNTLAIRTRLSGVVRLDEALSRSWQAFSEAFLHQAAPFDQVVRWARAPGRPEFAPFFRILFNYRNVAMGAPAFGALQLKLLESRPASMLLDLSVEVAERGEQLEICIGYRKEQYLPSSIQRTLRQLEAILRALVQNSEVELAELDLDAPGSSAEPPVGLNQTEVSWPAQTLRELWQQRVAVSQDRLALSVSEQHFTYAALDRAARAVARALCASGLVDEGVVVLWLPRSWPALVAMLAVMHAGGVHLVLDPGAPRARIRSIWAEVKPAWVITTAQHRAELPNPSESEAAPRIIVLEEALASAAPGSLQSPSLERPQSRADQDRLVYLMATSGSTGAPKVVMATQRGLLNRLQWMWLSYPFASDEVCCQKTALGFVDSVTEIFAPLLAGVPLRLLPDDLVRNPRRLIHALARHGATRITLVPSLLDAVIEQLQHDGESLPTLRYCIASGETLPARTAARLGALLPRVRLLNLYGATEIAGDSTWEECSSRDSAQRVAIGRPIANTTIHVLDGTFRRVPSGARGEAYVGGAGLARGYFGRPDVTACRFVPNPFAAEPGERMYRTGDSVRLRGDERLEHLGRVDQQVKIRGHRVELAEVEGALGDHPAIARAAVVARAFGPRHAPGEDARLGLAAFLEFSGEPPSVRALRQFLRERLPESMVPSKWFLVSRMPLTTSGKIDRGALGGRVAGVSLEQAPPQSEAVTPNERELARLFAEVLQLQEVTAEGDFFDLGGHSLAVARLAVRVREVFGQELPLRAVFEHPTVRELSLYLAPVPSEPVRSPVSTISRLEGDAAPLSHAQESLWFLQRLDPSSVAYNETFIARRQGALNLAALEESFVHTFERHETLRTRFELSGGEPVQRITSSARVPIRVVDATALSDDVRHAGERLAQQVGRRPFDLAEPPVVRVLVARLSGSNFLVVLSLHHIVADAWSVRRLTDEIAEAYERIVRGLPLAREAASQVRYVDYAAWQRQHATAPRLSEQIEYWRSRLAGVSVLPALGRTPASSTAPCVRSLKFELSGPCVRALREFARARGATSFMVLLGAWMTVLSAASGQNDVAVGCPVANRPRRELEQVVGLFVNTLVLRCDVALDATFESLLEQVRRIALDAYANQDCPFELLVRELSPPRARARTPLYNAMLVFHAQPTNAPAFDLGWSLSMAPATMTKTDWLLTVTEHEAHWAATLEFDAARQSSSDAQRLLRDFTALLERVSGAPGEPLQAALVASSIAIAPRLPRVVPSALVPAPSVRHSATVPDTPVAARVAEICRSLLAKVDVSTELTFFELGGHSLSAVKFQLALEQAFPGAVTLQDLFDDLSLADLSRRIEGRLRSEEPMRTVREIDF